MIEIGVIEDRNKTSCRLQSLTGLISSWTRDLKVSQDITPTLFKIIRRCMKKEEIILWLWEAVEYIENNPPEIYGEPNWLDNVRKAVAEAGRRII